MKRYAGWVALLLVAAFLLGGLAFPRTVQVEKWIPGPPEVVLIPNSGATFASMQAPAVDPNGEGVMVRVDVQSRPGTGQILANIDKILFWVDTQHSIRTAKEMAENMTGIDLDTYDLTYTITANASVIEGPSAGAAITIATIAAAENRTLNPRVMITGTVEEDGTIGPAGGILEKARAAREAGATLFLIPEGATGTEGAERVKNCTTQEGRELCRIEYVPKKTDMTSEAEITVREVSTIEEALGYFL